MRWLVWMLIGLAASECVSAALNSTSAAVSTSVYDAVGERRLATGLKRNRASVSRRRKTSNANRRARSKLAKSCGGQVGSVLLEEWFRFCQLVFTASVEDIDRERGTVRVSMRRVIRSLSNVSDWTVASFLSPPNQNQPSLAGQSNALDPLPAVDTTDNPLIKPTLILHDLFDARENSCVPQFRIRIHDVLLFLVQIHPLNQTLHLVSAPLRITLRNLKLIHTSPGSPSSDVPYDSRSVTAPSIAILEDKPDPCADLKCPPGAKCIAAADASSATCQCPTKCSSYGDSVGSRPVCGADGKDYPNTCELHKSSCLANRRIDVKFQGACDPCASIECLSTSVCVLDSERKPHCRCGDTCPSDFQPVCGSDGRSYSSQCHLMQEACRSQRQLRILYKGLCESAGKDWFSSFLKRNKRLSIRKPEATSQARAAALNKVVMNNFYDQVDELYEKHKFDADSVFNTDETNNTTVVEPAKIIAQKGTHQVYQMTSQERGVNVTMLPFVNASGKLFGGVFVFPRKKVSEKMKNLPEGFIALAHSSGWMTEENFLIALKHFHSQVQSRPTKEKPILLFLDNHISHMGYSICIFAKENGIILQTLPPHTSHASQPLDRTTFGPFKSNLADSHSDWMREHPGQRISIYEIPLLSKPALQRAFTEKNIKKGFKATGLFPFNRNAIPDSMYAPSIVTDLPAPTEVNSRQNGLTICNAIQHLPISVNQTLRFEMPSSIAAQHTTVATQEPPKSHYLLTVSSAGQLTLSPISVSPVAQPQAGPSSEIRSSSSTPIIQTEHERTTPTGSPSTINDMASTTASLPNQLSPQQLLTTPVKFREPHAFRPQDLLQLPQVAQNGPRNSNHNKRLGASRCLTSSPEIKRIREEHEEKERKLKAAENRKIAKATKAKAAEGKRKSNKVHSVEEDQYFETTPAVSNPQQGRKSTSRVLRYDKENVSSINLVEEEEDLPSEPRNSPVVPRRERITRAVKQNRMRNVCGR